MSAFEFTYKSGDVRYFLETGTTTAATSTGFAMSHTAANGAIYHSVQIDALSFPTTTGQAVFLLQGSLDNTAPTYWFEMNKLTLTAAATTTLISAAESCRWVRGIVDTINTQASFSLNMKMMGNAVTYGRPK